MREAKRRSKSPRRMTKDVALPKGKAVRLAGAIAYSEGAIVSRTLIENDGGTLTLFAFDAGQGLSEHSAPFDAVVQVIEGEARLVIGGRGVRAGEGTLVIMPANVPHAVKAQKRFKMLLTMLSAG